MRRASQMARLSDFGPVPTSPGLRGITPAFGYSAPHPSTEGTLTPMTHVLPSAPDEIVCLMPIAAKGLDLLGREILVLEFFVEDLPRHRLPLHFEDAKAAPRKGKSSRFKALGCCTSRRNSGGRRIIVPAAPPRWIRGR